MNSPAFSKRTRLLDFGLSCLALAVLASAARCPAGNQPPLVEEVPLKAFPSPPSDIQFRPDGSGEIFVVELGGTITVCNPTALTDRPFLDISDRVRGGGENGLLGMAFPPAPADRSRFYVCYTGEDEQMGNTIVVSRFTIDEDSAAADPASEEIILAIPRFGSTHNGGQIRFGPDGHLYVAIGDNGAARNIVERGQDLTCLHGKILRIDSEGAPPGTPYVIPPANPYADRPDARPEIVAYGFRNPWRFAFDPSNDDLLVGDVGEFIQEELNRITPEQITQGLNFGWPHVEGTHENETFPNPGKEFQSPLLTYTEGSAIIGGIFSAGDSALAPGCYFFGDFDGSLYFLEESSEMAERTLVGRAPGDAPTCLGQDEFGTIYGGNLDHTLFAVRAVSKLPPVTISAGSPAPGSFRRVTLRSPQAGAAVRYTLDGSEPNDMSPSIVWPERLDLYEPATLKARTTYPGIPPGPVTSERIEVMVGHLQASTDSLEHDPSRIISLTASTPDVTIRYTLDGTEVTRTSPVYEPARGLILTKTTQVRARGHREGWLPGPELRETYQMRVARPTVIVGGEENPTDATLYEPVSVVSQTRGARIHYTLDGSVPTLDSPLYEKPLILSPTETLSAIAYSGEMQPSLIRPYRPSFLYTPALKQNLHASPEGGAPDRRHIAVTGNAPRIAFVDNYRKIQLLQADRNARELASIQTDVLQIDFDGHGNLFVLTSRDITRFDGPDYDESSIILTGERLQAFHPGSPGPRIVAKYIFQAGQTLLTRTGAGVSRPVVGRVPGSVTNFDVAPNGSIFLTNDYFSGIGQLVSGEHSLFASSDTHGHRDGPVETALFDRPQRIAVDRLGNIYFADRVELRRISPDGTVTTLRGQTLDESGNPLYDEPGILSAWGQFDVDDNGVIYGSDRSTLFRIVLDDWDNDGIPDETEREEGPPLTVGVDDRHADADGDGLSNAGEYVLRGATGPAMRRLSARNALLAFPVEAGSRCQIEFSDDLEAWHPLGGETVATHHDVVVAVDLFPGVSRLFRCVSRP